MRDAFDYDASEGCVKTVLRLSASVVPRVLSRTEIWLFLCIHLAVFIVHWVFLSGLPVSDEDAGMDWREVNVITSITAFAEVFYTNECYARYVLMHDRCRRMLGSVYDFVFTARLYMRPAGPPYDRVACRLVVATVVIFMHEAKNGKVAPQLWQQLIVQGLLKPDELEFLRGLDSRPRCLVMLHAAGDAARVGLTEAGAPSDVLEDAAGHLLAYRGLWEEVRSVQAFAVPFGYFHLLNVMIMVNLFIWAYGMAIAYSFWAPGFFFLTALVFLGMMDLATQLSNPFGNDEVDFPVNQWVLDFAQNVAVLLDYEHAGAEDYRLELQEEAEAQTRLKLNRSEVEDLLAGGTGPAAASPPWSGSGQPLRPAEVIPQNLASAETSGGGPAARGLQLSSSLSDAFGWADQAWSASGGQLRNPLGSSAARDGYNPLLQTEEAAPGGARRGWSVPAHILRDGRGRACRTCFG